MKKLLLIMILTLSICACSDESSSLLTDSLGMKEKPLRISTEMLSTRTSHLIHDFNNSSLLGLYIMSGQKGTCYKNVKTEAKQEGGKISWKPESAILLNSEPVTIYAYYPYQQEENLDMTHIPVKICPNAALTNNYMYGTHVPGQKNINQDEASYFLIKT